jgi:hypothetical protein
MSSGMEASWHASSAMFKCAPVMPAEIAVIDHCCAARNVSVATVETASAAPSCAPGAETPAETAKDANSDSHAEGKSNANRDTDRVDCGKTRVGGKQPAPDEPRVVIRNEDYGRIHRGNGDDAGVSRRYDHLRRRN